MGDSRHFRIQNSGSLFYPFRAFTDGRVLIHTLQCEQNVGISGTLDVTGGISITGNLTLEDNNNLQLGSGQDLTLVHTGTASTTMQTVQVILQLIIQVQVVQLLYN